MLRHVRASEVGGEWAAPPHARTLKHLAAPWTLGSRQLWLGLSEVDPGSSSNRHQHPNEEVFYVEAGRGAVEVGDEREEIGPGSVVLFPSNTPHRLVNTGASVLRVVCAASPPFEKTDFDRRHLLG